MLEVREICQHPENYVTTYTVDGDDGYGYWWKSERKYCQICGKDINGKET